MAEPWAFLEEVTPTTTRWVSIWDQFLIKKQVSAWWANKICIICR